MENIRTTLLTLKHLKQEKEDQDFYINNLIDFIENELKDSKEHLLYQLEETERNLELVKIVKESINKGE